MNADHLSSDSGCKKPNCFCPEGTCVGVYSPTSNPRDMSEARYMLWKLEAEVERLRAELSDLGNPKAGVGYWVAECERLRGIEREYIQIHEAIGKLREAQDQFMMDATRPADEDNV